MKIGISGASGNLGRAIVRELEARGVGEQVVAISRSPETLMVEGETRRGDYDHPDTLAAAYAGIDRLVLIPSVDLRPGVRGRQIKAAVDAAFAAGVPHIVFLSAAGTRRAEVPAMGEAYWTGEQHLIRTASTWTIIRMNYYAESMAEEILSSLDQGVLVGFGDERVGYVSREDLATAVARAVLGEGHAGAIYNATGPALIGGPERAEIASEVLGKSLGYVVIGPEQLRAGMEPLGLPSHVLDAIVEIKTQFVEGYFDILTNDVERLSGRALTPFRDVLAKIAAHAAQN
ncbi:NAD(P)H-binding protein [Novosphingobium sp. BL-52-GroH]|uniref:NAD(P)H-binding protein n=1 Tax=Novosphingobium sp. BL-52-GroH TaxID=3349877 RepID=UPI00384C7CF2